MSAYFAHRTSKSNPWHFLLKVFRWEGAMEMQSDLMEGGILGAREFQAWGSWRKRRALKWYKLVSFRGLKQSHPLAQLAPSFPPLLVCLKGIIDTRTDRQMGGLIRTVLFSYCGTC